MVDGQTGYLCSLLLALGGLGAVGVIHGLGYDDWGTEWDLFKHDLEDNWEMYNLRIVVPEWMFFIWMVMYGIQIIWICYAFVAMLKKTKDGWLAGNPPILPSSIFVFFLLGLACTIAWVVVWDLRDEASFSILAAGGGSVFYTIALGISVYSVKRYGAYLRQLDHGCDVTFIQVFLHNGIGALTAWLPCITMYVMSVILITEDILDPDESEYVALGVIMGYFVIWLLADLCFFGKATSHILLPYLTYLLSFIMVIYQNYDDGEDFNTFFKVGVGLTCAGGFLTLIKISVNLGRQCTPSIKEIEDDFEGGAVEYRDPDYDYEKEHDSSQVGLVHY